MSTGVRNEKRLAVLGLRQEVPQGMPFKPFSRKESGFNRKWTTQVSVVQRRDGRTAQRHAVCGPGLDCCTCGACPVPV